MAPHLMGTYPTASNETIRDVNRHLILGLIRARQPISRADLARETGLQRSTVSLITDQLIQQRWVTEGATGETSRGRKPRLLYLNVERARIIGVDLRPALTTIAIADPNGRVIAYERIPTAARPEVFVRDLCRRLRSFLRAHPRLACEGIGITVPGTVDRRQRLVAAPNLGWRDVDLKGPVERATGIAVELENAANACAIAEALFGAHRGHRDLVVVTVSEGIGTGIISGGQLVQGASGLAGEFGHVCLDPDGPLCGCGRRGCWEAFASNSAALCFYEEATPGRARNRPAATGPALTFDALVTLAQQGDRRAARAIQQMGTHLGGGIAMLVTGLAPSLILVVGEVTRAWDIVGPAIDTSLAERAPGSTTRIVAAGDGAEARLRGTVALVLRKQFGNAIVA